MFTAEWILEHEFDGVVKQGSVHFIEVAEGAEWGVDVIPLDDEGIGAWEYDSVVAYRSSNPMEDGDWRVGDIDDLAARCNAVKEDWDEWLSA